MAAAARTCSSAAVALAIAAPAAVPGCAVDPGPDVLEVPYSWEDTDELPPFDYDTYDDVF